MGKANVFHLMKKISLVVGILLVLCANAQAAGSCTWTEFPVRGKLMQALVWTWTSDASGDVSGEGAYKVSGNVTAYAFLTDPETGVTDAYDLVITASLVVPTESSTRTVEWADILGAQGANLSNSTNGSNTFLTTPFSLVDGMTIEPTISNAGNATSGTIVLLLWKE